MGIRLRDQTRKPLIFPAIKKEHVGEMQTAASAVVRMSVNPTFFFIRGFALKTMVTVFGSAGFG